MMDFFRMLNSFFYGEHWYIYWGIVALLIIFAVAVRLPSFIKSQNFSPFFLKIMLLSEVLR